MPGPGGREVGRLSIRVLPDTSRFAVSLRRYLERIERQSQIKIRVVVDEPTRPVNVRARLVVDHAEITRLRWELAHLHPPITIPARLNVTGAGRLGALSGLSSVGSGAQRAAGGLRMLGTVVGALGAATPAIANLTTQLWQTIPALSVAAPTLLSLGSAAGAVYLGIDNVVDALKDDEEAIKRLTPSARAFTKEVRSLSDAWGKLRRDTQERLFKGLDESFETMAKATGPAFRRAMLGAAEAVNHMGRELAGTASQLGTDGRLGKALDGANRGLENMSTIPADIVDAFVTLSVAATPLFLRMTASMARGMRRVAADLRKALDSGALEERINHAATVGGMLLRLLRNIGQAIGAIFGPAAEAGGGTLGTLIRLFAELRDVASTESAQRDLYNVFSLLQNVGSTAVQALGSALRVVLPLIGDLASALVGPFENFSDRLLPVIDNVMQGLGDALGPIVQQVGRALGGLLPIVADLAEALGDGLLVPALRTVGPLLEEFTAVLLDQLQPVFAALPGFLTPVIQGLSDLLPPLTMVAGEVVNQMSPAMGILLGQLAQLLEAAGPLLGSALSLLAELILAAVPAVHAVSGAISIFNQIVAYSVAVVVQLFLPVIRVLTALLQGDFRGAWNIAKDTVKQFGEMAGSVAGQVASYVGSMASQVGHYIGDMASSAARKVGEMGSEIYHGIRYAMDDMYDAVKSAGRRAVSFIGDLPGEARDALGNVGHYLYDSGRALVQGFIDGIKSMFGSLRNAASSLLSGIAGLFPHSPAKEGPFSGLGWTLYRGRALAEGFADGIMDYRGLVHQAAESLTLSAHAPLVAEVPEYAGGLRPGDRIALTIDGQTTLDAVIQRGASRAIDRDLVDPARRGIGGF